MDKPRNYWFHTLPSELVQAIFVLLCRDVENPQDHIAGLRGKLRSVCWRWVHIVDSCPELWCLLYSAWSLSFTTASIQKAKDRPLEVFYDFRHHNAAAWLALVMNYTHRWRAAELKLLTEDLGIQPQWEHAAPLLESLQLDGYYRSGMDVSRLSYLFFGGIIPRLTKLTVIDLPLCFKSLPLNGLTSFHWTNSVDVEVSLTPFLSFLSNLQRLEDLILDTLYTGDLTLPAPISSVTYPYLKTISFHEVGSILAVALTKLLNPPVCSRFELVMGPLVDEDDYPLADEDQIFERLGGFVPWISEVAGKVVLDVEYGRCLVLQLRANSIGSFEAMISRESVEVAVQWLQDTLAQTPNHLIETRLRLDSELICRGVAIRGRLASLPNVHTVVLGLDADAEVFMDWFATSNEDKGWCFPDLQCLEIENYQIDGDDLVRALQKRYGGRTSTVTPLRKLVKSYLSVKNFNEMSEICGILEVVATDT